MSLPSHQLHPTLPVDRLQRVSSFIDWSSHSWNLSSLDNVLSSTQRQAILSVPLILESTLDKLIWPLGRTGLYTVKSGYHAAHALSSSHLISNPHSTHIIAPIVWKQVWSLHSLPKIKMFLWKAMHNSLATN